MDFNFMDDFNCITSKYVVMLDEDSADPIFFSDKELAAEFCLVNNHAGFLELESAHIMSDAKLVWFVIPDNEKPEKYVLHSETIDEYESYAHMEHNCL